MLLTKVLMSVAVVAGAHLAGLQGNAAVAGGYGLSPSSESFRPGLNNFDGLSPSSESFRPGLNDFDGLSPSSGSFRPGLNDFDGLSPSSESFRPGLDAFQGLSPSSEGDRPGLGSANETAIAEDLLLDEVREVDQDGHRAFRVRH